jgi:cobalt-zinc-cadmium efflux system outer membrane protein
MRLPLTITCAVVLGAAVVTAQQPAAQSTAPAALSLADLERMATQANPTLRAAESRIESARNRARQAGAWPNPTAGYSAEEIKLDDVDRRGEYGFFVQQPILLGGKLRLNRAVFDRAAEQAEAELELQRQRITSAVRTAFYRTLTADRRVEVQEHLAALVSEAVAITAQLFNVGAADRPDFLESEIESQRVQLELNAARNRAFALRQQLAAVVGEPEIAGRPLSGSLEDALPELEREATLRLFLDQSPQLRAARAALARAQAETAVGRRQTFPDLFLRGGAAYNREHGEDTGRPIGWEGALEAGISIPLFNRNRYGVAAGRAEEARAGAEVRRVELALRSQLAVSFATYLTALRESESYRTEIIPKAEEAYRLYLARYREMAAAYPQVLIAQRTLLELSSRYLERLEQAWETALHIQGFLAGEGLDAPGGAVDRMGRREDGGRQ